MSEMIHTRVHRIVPSTVLSLTAEPKIEISFRAFAKNASPVWMQRTGKVKISLKSERMTTLPHKARVCIHYGVEKHFKSEADRLFALFELYVKDARRQGQDLVEVAELCKFLEEKNKAARSEDATAPVLVVINDHDSQKKPAGQRYRLTSKHFHITRTYCVSSAPVSQAHSRLGVKVFNHIFSNMVAATNLTSELELVPRKDCNPDCRRVYWSETGRERWDHDVKPLGIHDETSLTRRQKAQGHLLQGGADQSFTGKAAVDCLVERRKRQAEKQKRKAAAKKEAANLKAAGSESSSSSSSSGSGSSDAASEDWKNVRG